MIELYTLCVLIVVALFVVAIIKGVREWFLESFDDETKAKVEKFYMLEIFFLIYILIAPVSLLVLACLFIKSEKN